MIDRRQTLLHNGSCAMIKVIKFGIFGNIDVVISFMYAAYYVIIIVVGLSHCTLHLNLATLTAMALLL